MTELAEGLRRGEVTSRRVTEGLLRRIGARERSAQSLRAVLTVNPDAERIARSSDLERKDSGAGSKGVLGGVPILLKDNVDTGDWMPTTAGSLALTGTCAPKDAYVTRRLREAGAVILGKTNLSEWANFRSSRSSSGWSAVGGQTRNPYALSRSPSGSSSGSAAAVAAGYAPAAIGTETDGSIVSPACHCSLVGLKPTVGLVSRSGIVPISHTQDTAGPMTRTVRDAALILGVIAGVDEGDEATREGAEPGRVEKDYTRFLDRDGMRGARLGVLRQAFGRDARVVAIMERQLSLLRELGAELVDPVAVPTWGRFGAGEGIVLNHEFKAGIAAYLATRGDQVTVRTLADLIAFNARHAEREMPHFGQEVFERAEASGPLTDPRYLEAREAGRRMARVEGIEAVMREHRLDALIAPTEQSPAWPIDWVNGDRYGGGCASLPAVAGCPHLTVPAGYVKGLPVGLSFMGRAWSEGVLLRLGHAYELASRVRVAPRFPRDVDGGRDR